MALFTKRRSFNSTLLLGLIFVTLSIVKSDERMKKDTERMLTQIPIEKMKFNFNEGDFVSLSIGKVLGTRTTGRTYSYQWFPVDGELYVDTNSGSILSRKELDYETKTSHWIFLEVFESDTQTGISKEFRRINVTIEVEDLNDTPPMILNPRPMMASVHPVSDVSVGDIVYTLRLNDPDVNVGQTRQWRLTTALSGNDRNLDAMEFFGFGVSLNTRGTITKSGGTYTPNTRDTTMVEKIPIVVKKIPIPANTEFAMPIRVEDEAGNSEEKVLYILTAPRGPQFNQDEYTIDVSESTPGGTKLGTIAATSSNGATIVYSLKVLSGSDDMFSIDSMSGTLTLEQKLDYDIAQFDLSSRQFKLQVTASESKIGSFESTAIVKVLVTDSNDCAPEFVEPVQIVNGLSELAPIGQVVLTAQATDCDATWPNNQVTITSSDPRFYFDNSTLQLKVASELDYDSGPKVFEFNLVARDGGQPTLTGTAHVKIILTNKPDEAPVFINTRKEDGGYYERISESITDESIVAKIDALDPDGLSDNIRFSFEQTGVENPFYINQETGIVKKSIGAKITQSKYKLNVRAIDDVTAARGDNKKESFAPLTIEVIEENNNIPVFKDCKTVRYESVSESAEVGSVVFEIEAVDEDSGRYGQVKYGLIALLANSNAQPEFQIRQKVKQNANQGGKVEMIGEVILLRKVSRDNGANRTLTINATDTYSPQDDTFLPGNQNVGICTVSVNIVDSNDKRPVFAISRYNVDISRFTTVGEAIIRVVAYDNDEGDNGKISYKLIDLSQSGNFQIDSTTGDVSVKSRQLESLSSDKTFNLIVTATDQGIPAQSTNATVVIKVLVQSVKPPYFTQSVSNIEVAENHLVGTSMGNEIGVFQADTPPESREMVLITLQTGTTVDTNGDKTFAIPATGDSEHRLFLVKPVDYEGIKRYYLTVKAALSSNPNIYTLKQVTVTVTDVNDEVPEFVTPDETFYGSVKEDDVPGTYVATVRAEDYDLGLGGEVYYSIPSFGTSDSSYFEIDARSGVVTLSKSLSNMDPPRSAFNLNVQARDNAPSANKGTQGVNVNSVYVAISVVDVNDHAPVFSQESYYVNVRETKPVGDVIIGVVATDEDQVIDQTITYTIERGNIGGVFEIDHDSGVIKLVRGLDFDFGQQTYNLTVLASDGKLAGRTSVLVNVIDENDEAPKFDLDLYKAESTENDTSLIGKTIINVHAIDQDLYLNPPGEVRYRLEGEGTDEQFSINEFTGEVKLNKVLDREHRSAWNLLVIAEDVSPLVVPNSNQITSAEVSIVVRDINDNPPYFLLPDKKGTIPENRPAGSPVMTMPAHDADENAQIKYAIVEGPTDLFEIDPDTAEIKTKKPLDREGPLGSQFKLVVRATDENGFENEGTASIEIEDVNDNKPSCDREKYVISVSEGAISGESIFSFNIEDKDTNSVNGENKVSITEGNIDSVFALNNPVGGVVDLLISSIEESGIIDYESDRKTYNLTIRVSDSTLSGVTSGVSECKIDITVLDYNDNDPIFDPSSVKPVAVKEDVSIGHEIARVAASDADEDGEQLIRFEVDWETDTHNWFRVEPDPSDQKKGIVRVKNHLDREMITRNGGTNAYTFKVLAIDRPKNIEQDSRQGSIDIVVTIGDVNDNAPVWAENYRPKIPENVGPGIWQQPLRAIDFDDGDMGNGEPISIEWAPGKKNPNFALDMEGGNPVVLRNLRPFDREKVPEYVLEFKLCDSGNPKMCAIRPLVVKVADENDNPPSDGNTYIHAYVWPELASDVDISAEIVNREIGEVLVTDEDCCNRTTQSYQMLTTDPDILKYFSVSRNFISLSEGTPADTYYLKVQVTDSLFPSVTATSTVKIYVEELEDGAMENAVAIRIKGMTASEFMSMPTSDTKSEADKFKDRVAALLNTQPQHVEIFSVTDIPASNEPLYPEIFEPPAVDIVVAVHGSPYYQSSKIYGILTENQQTLENNGVIELSLDDLPLNLCPGTCDQTESCETMMTFANKHHAVIGLSNAFVGIESSAEAHCGACESLQNFAIPDAIVGKSHPNPCFNNPCKNNGECTPVVTKVVANKAYYSYKCTCPAAYSGPDCSLKTLSFKGDDYTWFDSIPLCSSTTLSLKFATTQPNGLLFYNGPLTSESNTPDFIALELVDGTLKLTFNFGFGIQTTQLSKDQAHRLDDGSWHVVDVFIEEDLIKLQVDLCRNSFIKEDASVSNQDYHHCYAVQYLRGRKLDVTTPLQIGGVSNPDILPNSIQEPYFDGCVGEFILNDQMLDFSSPSRHSEIEEGCDEQKPHCFDDFGLPRCGLHGECIASADQFLYCDCHPRYQGPTCRQKSPEYTFEPTDSLIRYSVNPKGPVATTLLNDRATEITLSFRSTAKDMSEMILLSFRDLYNTGFIRIYIAKSILSLKHNLGGRGEQILRLEERNVTDGQWHSVRVKRNGKRFKMALDGGGVPGTMVYSDKGTFRLLRIDPDSIMIGGYSPEYNRNNYEVTSNFHGCISDVRFNRIQLPLGRVSTLSGVEIANRSGIADGCNPDPCLTTGLTCPGNMRCVAVFDTAHCACPLGFELTNFEQCVDIAECDLYNPCVHAIECRETVGSYECICEDNWSGRNCDEAGPAALVATATLSLAAILIILFAILFLILIILLYCSCSRRRRPRGLTAQDLDFADQAIGRKVVEGGGELDADFVLDNLRKPVNQVPPLTPVPIHPMTPNGKSPSVNHSIQNLGPGPRMNPRYVSPSPVPSHRSNPPNAPLPNDDVGRYLKSRVRDLDRNAANMGGHDTLMVYHYEGGDSELGTVSDAMSETSEANFDNFANMGPPFHNIAEMIASQPNANEKNQRSKTPTNRNQSRQNNLPPDVV